MAVTGKRVAAVWFAPQPLRVLLAVVGGILESPDPIQFQCVQSSVDAAIFVLSSRKG
jgi:hypothetical protein